MSMLSNQCEELRKTAGELREHGSFVCFGGAVSVDGLMDKAAVEMREAADTIENLRDRLQESYGQVPEQGEREDDGERESCSRWHQLFGTPERAARTLAKACGECDEDLPCCECPLYPIVGNNVYEPELLEWLRGDAE